MVELADPRQRAWFRLRDGLARDAALGSVPGLRPQTARLQKPVRVSRTGPDWSSPPFQTVRSPRGPAANTGSKTFGGVNTVGRRAPSGSTAR